MTGTGGNGRPRVCLLGTAPPRQCGIATFTDDLRIALGALEPPVPAVQVAMTDSETSYAYGHDVVFEVQVSQLSDYRAAGEFVDHSGVDLLCVQHEFGIFGGRAGRYVEDLLDHVSLPVVTTLHTVVPDPPQDLRDATRRLADRSDRLVVLAEEGGRLLETAYGIPREKYVVIPHGVPDLANVDPDDAKPAIDAEQRLVVMTFGLLSGAKGIEVVIDALPAVIADHPEVLYVVVGLTHPHVKRAEGEAYRERLVARASRLGVADHVRFENRYVMLDELCSLLAAADVYITPYHGTEQIVSGTLAYAVGAGRAVVSTPYPYARELLADGRGRLVPFADPDAVAAELNDLLGDPAGRDGMRRRAYEHGRQMIWSAVADRYAQLFDEVIANHDRRIAATATSYTLPRPSFSYLRSLTDDTGLFQHASYGVPDRAHGYCTDDVGRGLVVAVQGAARLDDAVAAELVPTYLSFLQAAQREDGTFENLLGYDRRFLLGTDSGDTLGQAVWGLGTAVSASTNAAWRTLARRLLDRSLPPLAELHHVRAMAYAICGLYGYLERFPGALAARRAMRSLAERLEESLTEHRRPGWVWFEPELTYANAKLSHALLLSGRACDDEGWTSSGLETLDFLLATTFSGDQFDFVGNDGWYHRGDTRADYGQQPIEAGYTAEACMVAYEVTGELRYVEMAAAAAEWLLGRNRLGVPLYDPVTGRCADGIDRTGVSGNAGAESVVSALLGLLAVPSSASGSTVDGPRIGSVSD